MLLDPLLPTLLLAAFATATLSATFGMAGGLVLMGVFTAVLPVPEAMVLHGLTQLVANGGRAFLLREHLQGRGIAAYAAGAAVAWALFQTAQVVPSARAVYLGIGAVPFVALLLPASPLLDFGRTRGAALCGLLVAGTQMLFGVAGPLLDVFFVRTGLGRHAVVSTKATTQTLSHALKIACFAPLLGEEAIRRLTVLGAVCVMAALAGTWAGGLLLERISEQVFRQWTRRLLFGVGVFYLWKGAC